MNSRDLFDGVVKGFCFGLSGIFTVGGLLANAGILPNLTIVHGTNFLVCGIVFYGIPGVMDRIDRHFASKVKTVDIAKMFEDETQYRGLGGGYRPIVGKKKRARKAVAKRKV